MSHGRRYLASAALLAVALLTTLAWLGPQRIEGIWRRRVAPLFAAPPNVAFETGDPVALGFDASALEALRAGLARRNTRALLVVRDDALALEWYRPGALPNDLREASALAKGVVGTTIALAAASDGALDLDAPASRYLPAWRDDAEHAAIRVRHLLAHSAGLENVSFPHAKAVLGGRVSDPDLPEWQRTYYADPAARFRMAVEAVPLRFRAGERYEYSGVGFYALAAVLEAALRQAGHPDLRRYLRERVLAPLGIPEAAWSISYDEAYRDDGRTLYAVGSGARITARALARVGELYANLGGYRGEPLLDAALVKRALSNARLPPALDRDGTPQPSIGLGWWVNQPVYFEALPPDAAIAAGSNHRVVLVVPSWRLVAVRTGGSLGQATWEGRYWRELEAHLIEPLAAAVAARP